MQKSIKKKYEKDAEYESSMDLGLDRNSQAVNEETFISLMLLEENIARQVKQTQQSQQAKDSVMNIHYDDQQALAGVDNVVAKKTVIKIDALFSERLRENFTNPDKNKKIDADSNLLLVGSPGSGKTTFIKKIVWLWTQGQNEFAKRLQQQFDWIFWLPLRTLDVKQKNLAQILYHHFLESYTELLDPKALELILDLNKSKEEKLPRILLLLDGYDEANNEQKKLVNTVLLAQQRCTVLMTSRLWSITSEVEEAFPIQLENMGFDQSQVKVYINQVAKQLYTEDTAQIAAFNTRVSKMIEANPRIKVIAYIPLCLAFICRLAHQASAENFSAINSLTDLYQQLINYMITHHRKRRLQERYRDDQEEKYYQKKLLSYYSQLAYRARAKGEAVEFEEILSQQVFDELFNREEKDLKEILQADCMGPHNPFIILKRNGKGYFSHLTFQEYFMAGVLVEDLSCLERYPSVENIITENRLNPNYRIVFRYVAGLLKENGDQLTRFFQLLIRPPRSLGHLKELPLWIECLEECGVSEKLRLRQTLLRHIYDAVFCFDTTINKVIVLGAGLNPIYLLREQVISWLAQAPMLLQAIISLEEDRGNVNKETINQFYISIFKQLSLNTLLPEEASLSEEDINHRQQFDAIEALEHIERRKGMSEENIQLEKSWNKIAIEKLLPDAQVNLIKALLITVFSIEFDRERYTDDELTRVTKGLKYTFIFVENLSFPMQMKFVNSLLDSHTDELINGLKYLAVERLSPNVQILLVKVLLKKISDPVINYSSVRIFMALENLMYLPIERLSPSVQRLFVVDVHYSDRDVQEQARLFFGKLFPGIFDEEPQPEQEFLPVKTSESLSDIQIRFIKKIIEDFVSKRQQAYRRSYYGYPELERLLRLPNKGLLPHAQMFFAEILLICLNFSSLKNLGLVGLGYLSIERLSSELQQEVIEALFQQNLSDQLSESSFAGESLRRLSIEKLSSELQRPIIEIMKELFQKTEKADCRIRCMAIEGLKCLSWEILPLELQQQIIGELLEIAVNTNVVVRRYALKMLGCFSIDQLPSELREQVIQKILQGIMDGSTNGRSNLLEALGHLSAEQLLPELQEKTVKELLRRTLNSLNAVRNDAIEVLQCLSIERLSPSLQKQVIKRLARIILDTSRYRKASRKSFKYRHKYLRDNNSAAWGDYHALTNCIKNCIKILSELSLELLSTSRVKNQVYEITSILISKEYGKLVKKADQEFDVICPEDKSRQDTRSSQYTPAFFKVGCSTDKSSVKYFSLLWKINDYIYHETIQQQSRPINGKSLEVAKLLREQLSQGISLEVILEQHQDLVLYFSDNSKNKLTSLCKPYLPNASNSRQCLVM